MIGINVHYARADVKPKGEGSAQTAPLNSYCAAASPYSPADGQAP